MQQLTLMLNSSLLIQLIILICQSISPQLLNFGLHHHLPHLIYSSTSQYSDEPLPSYSHLLDYSPSSIDQPQPTDSILVPRECMWNARLRCPPSVELIRDPVVEEYICSFQDHQPPRIELEDQDVITINTPPPYIENSDSDSDVICLE